MVVLVGEEVDLDPIVEEGVLASWDGALASEAYQGGPLVALVCELTPDMSAITVASRVVIGEYMKKLAKSLGAEDNEAFTQIERDPGPDSIWLVFLRSTGVSSMRCCRVTVTSNGGEA